jgi:hypothetical protein
MSEAINPDEMRGEAANQPTDPVALWTTPPVRLMGRVCAVRRLSKNLRFVDLMLGEQGIDTDSIMVGGELVELVVGKEHADRRLMTGDYLDVMGVFDEKCSKKIPKYNIHAVNKAKSAEVRSVAWNFLRQAKLWGKNESADKNEDVEQSDRNEEPLGAAGISGVPQPQLCRLWLTGRCAPKSNNPCRCRHFCVSVEEEQTRDRLEHLR